MPQGITYNAFPRALGVVTTPEFLLSDFFLAIFNLMAISKLLLDAFGEKGAWGASCPPIAFDSKN